MGDINWKNKCWVTTVYMIRPDGKVLLTWNKNLQTWIPVGGHIDPGETPEEAIKREVAEETGFSFDLIQPPLDYPEAKLRVLKPQHIQIETVPHHGHHINVVFFGKCTSWTGKEVTDENETLRWFSADELETMRGNMLESVLTNSLEAIRVARNL